jgi:taurine---2-oxoglutarate transaminase
MAKVNARLLEQGTKVSVRWNRIHLAPPLIISQTEMDDGLSALDYALSAADKWYTGP